MSVHVELGEMHRCSRISPEIAVSGIPSGTEYFDIRLVELGEEERFLGGGSWTNDGSGVIPEGAMTKHYRGPCPPPGRTKEYAFIVSAMGRNSIQPAVVRLYRFTQE
ncbi:MAG: MbtF [Desulfovibrio sp.]|nr:MbtF [Desulfovibrio sp.]